MAPPAVLPPPAAIPAAVPAAAEDDLGQVGRLVTIIKEFVIDLFLWVASFFWDIPPRGTAPVQPTFEARVLEDIQHDRVNKEEMVRLFFRYFPAHEEREEVFEAIGRTASPDILDKALNRFWRNDAGRIARLVVIGDNHVRSDYRLLIPFIQQRLQQ